MPLYEFSCCECGLEFEKLVRRQDETAELKCPECGSGKLEEKISTFASFSKGRSTGSAVACAPSGG